MQRYLRNMQIPSVGEEGQKKLLNSRVLIAGAGGLGSSVIYHLAAAGIGTLGIIDNDKVEFSNLNRQFIHNLGDIGKEKVISAKEKIENFNPNVKLNTYSLKLNSVNYKEIVNEYDIIVDCFDSYESKFLLNKIAVLTNKPLIHGGVTEFSGQALTIIPNETACLNCLFNISNMNELFIPKGVLSPIVGVIASVQATEVLKIILNIGEPLKNRMLTFDGLSMKFKELKILKNHRCTLCGE